MILKKCEKKECIRFKKPTVACDVCILNKYLAN